jgi:hypothetical protein
LAFLDPYFSQNLFSLFFEPSIYIGFHSWSSSC